MFLATSFSVFCSIAAIFSSNFQRFLPNKRTFLADIFTIFCLFFRFLNTNFASKIVRTSKQLFFIFNDMQRLVLTRCVGCAFRLVSWISPHLRQHFTLQALIFQLLIFIFQLAICQTILQKTATVKSFC